jgi:hypothetical protein
MDAPVECDLAVPPGRTIPKPQPLMKGRN